MPPGNVFAIGAMTQDVRSISATVTGSPSRIAPPVRGADQHRLLLVELPPVAAQPAHRQQPLVAVAEGDERAGADQAGDLAVELARPSRPRTARARAGSSARRRRRRARSPSRRARAPSTTRPPPRASRRARRVLARADRRQQRAVADEVRVAADRRREVAVARRAQAGVAEVARRVARLLERAQHERRERRAAVAACGARAASTSARACGDDRRPPAAASACSGTGGVGTSSDASWSTSRSTRARLRALVDAVQRRQLARSSSSVATASLAAIIRCSISRCDSVCSAGHGSVDVAVARRRRTPARRTRRPARRAPRARACERRGRRARGRQRLAPTAPRRRSAPAKIRSTRGVVEPLVGADQRAVERACAARRAPSKLELDGHRQAVLAGHERAGVVGQRLGQHRLDRAGHVDARSRAGSASRSTARAGPHVAPTTSAMCTQTRERAVAERLGARSRRRSRARSAGRS